MEATEPKIVSLNVTDVSTEEQLFALIIKQFGFPDLYGRNWRGMDEHLFYDPMMRVPKYLIVVGISSFEVNAPVIAGRFKEWIQSIQSVKVKYQEGSSE